MEFHKQPTRKSLLINQVTVITRQEKGTSQICGGAEGGNLRSSNTPKREGELFPSIPGKKEDRGSAPNAGSKRPQQKNPNWSLQNGEPLVNHVSNKLQRLEAIHRFIRRWSTRTLSPRFSEISSVFIQQPTFPISMPPIGILSAPRTFTKTLLPVIAFLRRKGLRLHHYLDDILLLADSREALIHHRGELITTLQNFRWLINWGKSNLQPPQIMTFLGADLDTLSNRVSLPQAKVAP